MKTLILLFIFLYLTGSAHTQSDIIYTTKKDTIKSIYNPFKKKNINPFEQELFNPLRTFTIKLDTIKFIYNPFKKKIMRVNDQIRQTQPFEREANNSYVIRIAGEDKEDNLNFYGVCFAYLHSNNSSTFSGLTLNVGMGNRSVDGGKPFYDLSINGINFSLFLTSTTGTINGFSFGGFLGNESGNMNGIAIGGIAVGSNYLNGLAIGGLISTNENANGIQIAGIFNGYHKFNGVGLAPLNIHYETFFSKSNNSIINGLILGGYNLLDVNGISIGIVNNGDSWLQIGLLNMGNGIVQIGLINLDGNYKMRIPLVSVNI